MSMNLAHVRGAPEELGYHFKYIAAAIPPDRLVLGITII